MKQFSQDMVEWVAPSSNVLQFSSSQLPDFEHKEVFLLRTLLQIKTSLWPGGLGRIFDLLCVVVIIVSA